LCIAFCTSWGGSRRWNLLSSHTFSQFKAEEPMIIIGPMLASMYFVRNHWFLGDYPKALAVSLSLPSAHVGQ
jgi:hypothetical protein